MFAFVVSDKTMPILVYQFKICNMFGGALQYPTKQSISLTISEIHILNLRTGTLNKLEFFHIQYTFDVDHIFSSHFFLYIGIVFETINRISVTNKSDSIKIVKDLFDMCSNIKLKLLNAVACSNIPYADKVLVISTDNHGGIFDLTHTSDLTLVSIKFETVVIIVLAGIELISVD